MWEFMGYYGFLLLLSIDTIRGLISSNFVILNSLAINKGCLEALPDKL